jgi:predicted flap endonuclease-1-like 5' DNA nuclease
MPKIEKIEGIGPVYAKKLVEAGIKTTDDLLKAVATAEGRKQLAEKTGIAETLILEWVNLADLFRIKELEKNTLTYLKKLELTRLLN